MNLRFMRLSTLLMGFMVAPGILWSQVQHPADNFLYDPTSVSRVDISIHPDSFQAILDNPYSNHEYTADMWFTRGGQADTVEDIGFRLRGNTSRASAKKSFKVAVNHLTSGRRYYGVKKLNLNGEHNDVSIMRARVCWELGAALGLPVSRATHTEVYINGQNRGLYINTEHINDDWLDHRFGTSAGNLYKCTYPASLNYLSNNPDDYKFIGATGDRAYELKTNEDADDYSDLAHFIDVINNTPDAQFLCEVDAVFNIESYMKALAFEVVTGHWDNYSVNQNNFYLYHHPVSGKFEYIPYDMDNTFGVDWFGVDWATENVNSWHDPSRMLSHRLLGFPEVAEMYRYYLEQAMAILNSPAFTAQIQAIHTQITPAAHADAFKGYDYGFTNAQFDQSLNASAPLNHVKRGILNFISARASSLSAQLGTVANAPILTYGTARIQGPPVAVQFAVQVEDADIDAVHVEYTAGGAAAQVLNLFDDGLHDDGAAGDGWYANAIPLASTPALSYQFFADDLSGNTRSAPRCAPAQLALSPTGILVINEFMADNEQVIQDQTGSYSDWIELYNNSMDSINLGDFYLTDDLSDPFQAPLSQELLPPGEFKLIWASGDPSTGSNHVDFKLSKGGEAVGLFRNNAGAADTVDFIIFGSQDSDVSWGRIFDAAPVWVAFDPSTPGASNGTMSIASQPPLSANWSVHPTPFAEQYTIENRGKSVLQVRVYDERGACLEILQIPPQSRQTVRDHHAPGNRFLVPSQGIFPRMIHSLKMSR